MLLCTFASQRSSPAKIHRWIAYLRQQSEKHRDDPQALQTIDLLFSKAESWRTPPPPE